VAHRAGTGSFVHCRFLASQAVCRYDTAYFLRRSTTLWLEIVGGSFPMPKCRARSLSSSASRALQCEDRRVDLERSKFPVSATQIRSNPYEFRHYIDPLVWRDMITWVVFLGAPCTGKSTIAQAMAARHSTLWMPEYGREYWEAHQVNRRLSKEQLLFIAQEHRRREDLTVRDAQQYLFVDTDASTTLQFSYYYHQAAEPQLVQLANDARQRYDLIFLCETDIPYSSTWDRSGDVARLEMQRRIEADLLARRIPVYRLQGNLDKRCQQVEKVLSRFRKTH
jgi:HTH-type transcriptional repressor of NAD biosynthesis genes